MGLAAVALVEGDGALQALLDRALAGEPAARDELIRLVNGRYRTLVHLKLSRDNPRVAGFEMSDDVLQEISRRLHNLLCKEPEAVPAAAAQFERWLPGWVAKHMRYVLTDMARKHFGMNGRGHLEYGAGHEDPITYQTSGPGGQRAQVHQLIGLLPEGQRRVIDLRYYLNSNYAKIGRALDLHPGKVREVEREALALLGKWLREGYRGEGPARPVAGPP